jgi:kynurenine formamidase
MSLAISNIIDISLELDDSKFAMRTPAGFKRDMQFQLEVLKEHDAPGGAGQIVRGVHMRLHAGSHVDAPEHNVRGGKQVQDLPLTTFAGDAVIADLRHLVPGKAITADELEKAVGALIRRGDRLLLRTDVNKTYMIDDWEKRSRYLRSDGTRWCVEKGVVLVGYDFLPRGRRARRAAGFQRLAQLERGGHCGLAISQQLGPRQRPARHAGGVAAQAGRRGSLPGAGRCSRLSARRRAILLPLRGTP